MIYAFLALAVAAVAGGLAGYYYSRTRRLEATVKDLADQLIKTEVRLAEIRKALTICQRDRDRAINALRQYGIRGNWTNDGGRDGRFAWTGGRDWPWLRARKGMGRFWTAEPGQEVPDGQPGT